MTRATELGASHSLTIATRMRLALLLELSDDTTGAAHEARQAYEASLEALGPEGRVVSPGSTEGSFPIQPRR
jgi:hypothetical protein